jgi:3-dehydroquinate dehydratase-2
MATKAGRVDAAAGKDKSRRVMVIHGPNLNLLGDREPEIYGRVTLKEIDRRLKTLGRELGLAVETFQSNSEGAIIDRIHRSRGRVEALLINAGAYSHTSYAIRDALAALDAPVIEVHLSNIHRREAFRHHSTISGVAHGIIMGLGADSYMLALRGAANLIAPAPAAGD